MIVCVWAFCEKSSGPLVDFFNRSRNWGSIGFAPGKNSYAAWGMCKTSELYKPGITNPSTSEHSILSLRPSRCCSSGGRRPRETSSSTTWLINFFNWIAIRFWTTITIGWSYLSILYGIFPQIRGKSKKELCVRLWKVHYGDGTLSSRWQELKS